jgi:hypothetical protein
MSELEELKEYLRKRDELFCNPTLERAKEFMHAPPEGWSGEDVPLAGVHKARLQWIDVTDAMIEESTKWLIEHNYNTSFQGAPPYTPERRDDERATRGLAPLKGK